MSESTYQQDQRMPGDPQITGGGGHEPTADDSVASSGVGGEDERRAPDAASPVDLKTSELPDPDGS